MTGRVVYVFMDPGRGFSGVWGIFASFCLLEAVTLSPRARPGAKTRHADRAEMPKVRFRWRKVVFNGLIFSLGDKFTGSRRQSDPL